MDLDKRVSSYPFGSFAKLNNHVSSREEAAILSSKRTRACCFVGALVIALLHASAAPKASYAQQKGKTAEAPKKSSGYSEAANDVIYFGFDSAILDKDARRELDEAVRWLKEDEKRMLVIEGHADQQGSADHNEKLSYKRARNAREYIVSQGIAPSRVEVVAYGETFVAYDTPALNRRVVFYTTRPDVPRASQASAAPPAPSRPGAMAGDESLPRGAGAATAQVTYVQYSDEERLLFPWGMSVSVGGGVTSFLEDDTRAFTDTGGNWSARLAIGTRLPVTLELAYQGSLQDIDAMGLDRDAMLLGNGVEANIRLNASPRGSVQPYILAGVGWTRYRVTNDQYNTSNVEDEEDVLLLPVGAGVGFRWRGMLLDVRGVVRPALYDDLIIFPDSMMVGDESIASSSNLDNGSIEARLGWEF